MNVTAGAMVHDDKGGDVGTIDSVANGVAVINTGTVKVGVPLGSFAMGPQGPIIGSTRDALNAAAGQAASAASAALKAQLTPGANVYASDGASVGVVKVSDDQYVTVTTAHGPVKLPIAAFSKGPSGLTIAMTSADLDKAVTAAVPGK